MSKGGLKRARRRRGTDPAALERKRIGGIYCLPTCYRSGKGLGGAPSHTGRKSVGALFHGIYGSLFFGTVLGALFLESAGEASPWSEPLPTEGEWREELEVSEEELAGVIKR